MIFGFIALAVLAYLLGSIPSGYLIMRWARGVDIRKVGTGKIGASNVMRSGSKKLAIPVALFDILKGVLPVLVARFTDMPVWQWVVVGLLAIIGHNWPLYLKFRSGGRGIFVSAGVITALSWQLGIFVFVFPYLFAPIKQVALGVFCALIILPILSWFLPGLFSVNDKLTMTIGFAVLTAIALARRLVSHRSELSKSVPWGEIIFNRLLFDRDIGDRRMWNSRAAQKSN
ncbi:MAG TPA: glycerol-3-phosphate acyltransferase [Dehalococcoidales bacterium]|nr:glycerol-3-phosphate acyltransferase [Dehalococcoidales bacterium]